MEPLTAPVSGLLSRLQGARRSGDGWTARCPGHDDRTPSLSIGAGRNGGVVLHCHAGCTVEHIVASLGLTMADLFPDVEGGEGVPTSRKRFEPSNPRGCTLEAYADAKRLPPDFLRSLGLSTISYQSSPAVRIPYRDVEGKEDAKATRYRVALTGKPKVKSQSGGRGMLYGLDQLAQARDEGYVVLVEGESDAQTCWHHDVPALGVAGASNWREDRDAAHLDGIPVIYVVVEPDRGGQAMRDWIARSRIRDRVKLVRIDGFKDTSALHIEDPGLFRQRLQAALDSAEAWSEIAAAQASQEASEALDLASDLLSAPDLIKRISDVIRGRGYVGDTRPAMTAYLAMTSRLLDRPANLALVGPSAAGKNRAVDSAAELMPDEALYIMTAGSARALIYNDEDFEHRVVIVAEADSIPDEGPAASAVRSIAEDNMLRYDTVERNEKTGKFTTRHIVKPGPTSLITTSIRSLAHQLGTRMLEVPVTDTEEQTREVMRAHARRVNGSAAEPPDPEPFVAMQRWLTLVGERRVVVPFAEVLLDMVPATHVRMRRDAAQLITFIQAAALPVQRQRERAPDGSVLASIDDYAVIRDLLAPIFDSVAADGVTPAIRDTVGAVLPGEEISQGKLARRLGMADSSVSYRVGRALRGGWLVDRETRKGHGKRLALGATLPEATPALPEPFDVRAAFERSKKIPEMQAPLPLTESRRQVEV